MKRLSKLAIEDQRRWHRGLSELATRTAEEAEAGVSPGNGLYSPSWATPEMEPVEEEPVEEEETVVSSSTGSSKTKADLELRVRPSHRKIDVRLHGKGNSNWRRSR